MNAWEWHCLDERVGEWSKDRSDAEVAAIYKLLRDIALSPVQEMPGVPWENDEYTTRVVDNGETTVTFLVTRQFGHHQLHLLSVSSA